MTSSSAVAIVLLADKGQQEMVDLMLPFWARQPEELFIMTHTDAPVTINPTSERSLPIQVLEYSGDFSDVFSALNTDEQLSAFDNYLIITPSTVAFQTNATSCIPTDTFDPSVVAKAIFDSSAPKATPDTVPSAVAGAAPSAVAGASAAQAQSAAGPSVAQAPSAAASAAKAPSAVAGPSAAQAASAAASAAKAPSAVAGPSAAQAALDGPSAAKAWTAGHGWPIAWSREAIRAADKHLSSNATAPTASWKPFVVRLIQEAKIPKVSPAGVVTSASCGNLVQAADAVQSRSATLVTDVDGPATLAFLLDALKSPTPLRQKKEVKVEVKEVMETPRVLRSEVSTSGPIVRENRTDKRSMTFVTALFDIRGREAKSAALASVGGGGGKAGCKSAAEYLKLGKKLLEWDVNLFLMVEPSMVSEIYKARAKTHLRHKTFIYPVTVEQSRYFHLIAKLEKLYAAGKIPQQYWPPKDTPLYVWCMMQKADALRRAMEMNLFGSSKFFWIDYGIFHIAEPPRPSLKELLDQLESSDHTRIRCNMLRPLNTHETDDPQSFYSRSQQCFAGGFFGGLKESMEWFVEEWEKEMIVATDHFPALDQAMFGRIYNRYRDRFLPVNGFHDGHRKLLQPRSHEHLMNELKWTVGTKAFDVAECLVQEINPRPWANEPWTDTHLQLAFLQLVAEVDTARTGFVHPNVAKQLALMERPRSGALMERPRSGGDAKMDGETFAKVMAKLQGWIESSRSQKKADQLPAKRIHEFVADFGARTSVVESLPCVNAMLELLAGTHVVTSIGQSFTHLKKIPIWVLNLDRRQDRWRQMQQAYAMLGRDRHDIFSGLRRFSAVDGSKQKDYLMSLPFWQKSSTLPLGAVACTASHMQMWQEWAQTPAVDGQQWLQILEDDVTFSPSFLRDMGCLQHLWSAGGGATLAKTYHTIWNGFHQHLQDRWKAITSTEPIKLINLKDNGYSQFIGGTFAYLISKTGAKLALKLLQEQYNLPADTPIDVWLMRMVHDRIRHMSPQRAIVLSDFYLPGQPYDGDIADTSRHQKKQ